MNIFSWLSHPDTRERAVFKNGYGFDEVRVIERRPEVHLARIEFSDGWTRPCWVSDDRLTTLQAAV